MDSMSTKIEELPGEREDVDMEDMQQQDLSKYNDNNTNIQFDIQKRKGDNYNSNNGNDSLVSQLRSQINEENLVLLFVVSVFMMSRTSNYLSNIPFLSRFGSNEIVFSVLKGTLAVVTFLFVKNTLLKYMKL